MGSTLRKLAEFRQSAYLGHQLSPSAFLQTPEPLQSRGFTMVTTASTYPRIWNLLPHRYLNINQGYILKPQYRPHFIHSGVPDTVKRGSFTSTNRQPWALEQVSSDDSVPVVSGFGIKVQQYDIRSKLKWNEMKHSVFPSLAKHPG